MVNGSLDRAQEIRRPLHFVDRAPVEATHKSYRILAGTLQDRVVVQREIGAFAGPETADKGRLAAQAVISNWKPEP